MPRHVNNVDASKSVGGGHSIETLATARSTAILSGADEIRNPHSAGVDAAGKELALRPSADIRHHHHSAWLHGAYRDMRFRVASGQPAGVHVHSSRQRNLAVEHAPDPSPRLIADILQQSKVERLRQQPESAIDVGHHDAVDVLTTVNQTSAVSFDETRTSDKRDGHRRGVVGSRSFCSGEGGFKSLKATGWQGWGEPILERLRRMIDAQHAANLPNRRCQEVQAVGCRQSRQVIARVQWGRVEIPLQAAVESNGSGPRLKVSLGQAGGLGRIGFQGEQRPGRTIGLIAGKRHRAHKDQQVVNGPGAGDQDAGAGCAGGIENLKGRPLRQAWKIISDFIGPEGGGLFEELSPNRVVEEITGIATVVELDSELMSLGCAVCRRRRSNHRRLIWDDI